MTGTTAHREMRTAVRVPSYIPGLDGVRALAFGLVFAAHGAPARAGRWLPAGTGVTIFFFLSGFLITTLLRREWQQTGTVSLRNFYLRRALRILPPLWITYIVADVLDRLVLHTPASTPQGLLSLLFYYFNYGYVLAPFYDLHIYVPTGLSVAWSLCVEEHFYLLFPALFLYFQRSHLRRRTQVRLLAGFCLLECAWRCVLVLAHVRGAADWTYYATDTRLDSILWGALLAWYANPLFGDRQLVPRRYTVAGFYAGVALLLLCCAGPTELFRSALRYTLQAAALMAIFTFLAARPDHPVVRLLENRVIRYIGWTSYTLYLAHYVMLHAIHILLPGHSWESYLLLDGGLTLGYAAAMRTVIELPLQTLRSRLHSRARMAAA